MARTILGILLSLGTATWLLLHRHQPANRTNDIVIVLALIGIGLSAHFSYRTAKARY